MDFKYVIGIYEQHLQNINLAPKTISQYIKVISEFADIVKETGIERLIDLKGVHMDMYMSTLIHRGNKPATRSRKKSVLNTFFSYCVKREIVDKNPVEVLERVKITDVDRKEKKVLNERQKNNIFKRINNRSQSKTKNVAIFMVLLYGALRVSELCDLKWPDIDYKNKTMVVRGKGRKIRKVPIVEEMEEALKGWKEDQVPGCEYVFTAKKTKEAMKVRSVHQLVKTYTKGITLENGVGPHRLRATAATDYLRAGVNLRYIQSLLGHTSLATTQHYMQPEELEVSSAIRTAAQNMKKKRSKE